MIRLSEKPDEPKYLRSKIVKRTIDSIKAKVDTGQQIKSNDFQKHWKCDEIREAIWKHQHGKCCYCERKRGQKMEADIEHYRPKAETAEDGNPGYWWLAYAWDNLFFACKDCNQKKGCQFPLVDGRRVKDLFDDLSLEKPILPHPINEDPEKFITYIWDNESTPVEEVRPVGKDRAGRGEKTIKILGLDRPELTSEQSRAILGLEAIAVRYVAAKYMLDHGIAPEALLAQVKEEIRNITSAKNEFAGIKRSFFRFRVKGIDTLISRDR